MLFLGIDIGTTNIKFGIYNIHGERTASSEFPTPVAKSPEGFAEYDMEDMWKRVLAGIKQTAVGMGALITAIAISSQGESCVLTDEQFTPLTKAIPWYDMRTKDIRNRWEGRITAERIYRITGLELQSIYSLLKLEWMMENRKEEYEKADYFHCMSDYVAGKLCGIHAMSRSMASRTMAYDLNQGEWSEELIHMSGVRRELFPDLIENEQALGRISRELAEKLGITKDAQVVIVGFDHMAGCAGVAGRMNSSAIASIGTTESICFIENKLQLGEKYNGYLWGAFLYKNTYFSIGGIPSGGQTIDWLIRNILSKMPNIKSYEELTKLCSQSPVLSHGILFLPHLSGCCAPEMNNDSKGAFLGLSKNTVTADLVRAVIEGLCYEFKMVLEQSRKKNVNEIIAIGGGSKNNFWMQCKADVLGIPVSTVKMEDAVTYGNAYMAACTQGFYEFGFGQNSKIEQIFMPNMENHKLYGQVYELVYKKLYYAQKEVIQNLSDLIQA